MPCSRVASIRDTVFETVYHVATTHTNPLGTLHGGVMLRWMVTTATMASMRATRSYTVLAGMDNVFFLSPLRVGENAVIQAWIDYAGTTSLEVTLLVEAEDPVRGERRMTTVSHMTMVSVGEDLRPKPHGLCIDPQGGYEKELFREALRRRSSRPGRDTREREAKNTDKPKPLIKGIEATTHHLVNPEDTIAYNVMHAGRLLYLMDELAGIVAMKYAKGIVVTGAVDATSFYSPIRVGDILRLDAALSYVGRRSMEVTIKAVTRNPFTGEEKHTTTSYFTMIHLAPDGRSAPVPRFEPVEEWQRGLLKEAEARRRLRLERLEFVRSKLSSMWPRL
ncbi:MAG: acyl-CoA thioesterase [Desulfurococcales archaeon]|nr:acyl-CoA thioesterase [Desulfurococcales archaeon]